MWVVGDAVVNGSETGTSFNQALYFEKVGFNLHDTMIYEKNGSPFPDKTRYYQTFEYMFVFSKGTPEHINLLKDRKNVWKGAWGTSSVRQKDGSLKKRSQSDANEYGVRFNIWRYNVGLGFSTKDKYAYEHPAMFPEKLAQDHINSWSNKGDIVLDPMNGSGTTTKMAYQLGRNYIGIEISPEYCKIAEERLKQQTLL